jgi:hypothetical protein
MLQPWTEPLIRYGQSDLPGYDAPQGLIHDRPAEWDHAEAEP